MRIWQMALGFALCSLLVARGFADDVKKKDRPKGPPVGRLSGGKVSRPGNGVSKKVLVVRTARGQLAARAVAAKTALAAASSKPEKGRPLPPGMRPRESKTAILKARIALRHLLMRSGPRTR